MRWHDTGDAPNSKDPLPYLSPMTNKDCETARVTLHMVMSVDGLIARPDKSIEWFNSSSEFATGVPVPELPDLEEAADCYMMGSRTYEHASHLAKEHGWPYGEVPTYVLSVRPLPVDRESVRLWPGDLLQLMQELKGQQYRNVWVVGGASVVSAFLREGLAHELRLVVLPIVLGQGLPFFSSLNKEYPLQLLNCTAYRNGMIELRYTIGQ
jgi:dihydrofolate reductase